MRRDENQIEQLINARSKKSIGVDLDECGELVDEVDAAIDEDGKNNE